MDYLYTLYYKNKNEYEKFINLRLAAAGLFL